MSLDRNEGCLQPITLPATALVLAVGFASTQWDGCRERDIEDVRGKVGQIFTPDLPEEKTEPVTDAAEAPATPKVIVRPASTRSVKASVPKAGCATERLADGALHFDDRGCRVVPSQGEDRGYTTVRYTCPEGGFSVATYGDSSLLPDSIISCWDVTDEPSVKAKTKKPVKTNEELLIEQSCRANRLNCD